MVYEYRRLEPGHIRLAVISPRSPSHDVRCGLLTVPLATAPTYEALSYAWGTASRTWEIYPEDLDKATVSEGSSQETFASEKNSGHQEPLRVTLNLLEALRGLRDRRSSRFFWIDSLCINQDDVVERAEQVQVMYQIYRQASAVVIWLGKTDFYTKAAFQIMHEISTKTTTQEELWGAEDELPVHLRYRLFDPTEQTRSIGSSASDALDEVHGTIFHWEEGNSPRDTVQPFYKLLLNPWFQRVWVFQESVAGRHKVVQQGDFVLEWSRFVAACDAIRHLWRGLPPRNAFEREQDYRPLPPSGSPKDPFDLEVDVRPASWSEVHAGGGRYLGWEDVAEPDKSIRTPTNVVDVVLSMEAVRASLPPVADGKFADTGFHPRELLPAIRDAQAGNPRDHYYGVVSLLHKRDIIPEVDYEKPVEEVFVDTIDAWMRAVGNGNEEKGASSCYCLDFLAHAGPVLSQAEYWRNRSRAGWENDPDWESIAASEPEHNPSPLKTRKFVEVSDEFRDRLPSWVPDWSSPLQAQPLSKCWVTALSERGFCAGGHELPKKPVIERRLPSRAFLKVQAVRVMAIDGVGTLPSDGPSIKLHSASGPMVGELLGASRVGNHYPTTNYSYASVLRRLGHDALLTFRQLYGDERTPFWSYVEEQKRKKKVGKMRSWKARRRSKKEVREVDDHAACLLNCLAYKAGHSLTPMRSFFTTDLGFMGLAPLTAAKRDEVWVVLGAETPMLLRRRDDGYHSFVGECFVYGIMHGEVMKGLDWKKVKEVKLR